MPNEARLRALLILAASALVLGGCALVGAVLAVATVDKYKKCAAEVKATPESQTGRACKASPESRGVPPNYHRA
jgi:hypothetical protein